MITHVQQVKAELKLRLDKDPLIEKAYHCIESLEESITELEREIDDTRQDFDALNREFDEYVSDHE